jgi:hypothetical protein
LFGTSEIIGSKLNVSAGRLWLRTKYEITSYFLLKIVVSDSRFSWKIYVLDAAILRHPARGIYSTTYEWRWVSTESALAHLRGHKSCWCYFLVMFKLFIHNPFRCAYHCHRFHLKWIQN